MRTVSPSPSETMLARPARSASATPSTVPLSSRRKHSSTDGGRISVTTLSLTQLRPPLSSSCVGIAGGPAQRRSGDVLPPQRPDLGVGAHEQPGDHLVERFGEEEALAAELRALVEVAGLAVRARPRAQSRRR